MALSKITMPHMHIPELTGATFKLDAKKLELMYGHDPIALVPLNSSKGPHPIKHRAGKENIPWHSSLC
jgi:hypothetical protein